MSNYVLKEIKSQCRRQHYLINGNTIRLDSKAGYSEVPDSLLAEFINEAANDVNGELLSTAEVMVDNCITDSDEKLLPANILAIKEIEIFDAETPTVTQGNTVSQVYSLAALYGAEKNPTAGVPKRFMIWENQGELYFKFNKTCAADYQIHIYFYTDMAVLSSSTDETKIRRPYDSLIRTAVKVKIAEQLNDVQSLSTAMRSYSNQIHSKLKTLQSFRTPGRTAFKEVP